MEVSSAGHAAEAAEHAEVARGPSELLIIVLALVDHSAG